MADGLVQIVPLAIMGTISAINSLNQLLLLKPSEMQHRNKV